MQQSYSDFLGHPDVLDIRTLFLLLHDIILLLIITVIFYNLIVIRYG